MEELAELRHRIKNFHFKRQLGYSRLLIQMFGFLGNGKSSFINTCKYVWDGGEFINHTGASGDHGGHTLMRIAYPLTKTITLVDNRGCAKLNSFETGELYAQLANLLPLNDQYWYIGFGRSTGTSGNVPKGGQDRDFIETTTTFQPYVTSPAGGDPEAIFALNGQSSGYKGYSRLLLQLFGYLGNGKSSFINTCKYVWDEGEFINHAGAGEDYGSATKIRNSFPLTKTITLVDNRGCLTMDSYETGEIYAQLDTRLIRNDKMKVKKPTHNDVIGQGKEINSEETCHNRSDTQKEQTRHLMTEPQTRDKKKTQVNTY
ncbi:Hypothetical predicted protein [Pelobates cultripes]|uniref:Uncharacterized protein n=1 Tax=Pelobates cultripes TaxID=61616 RepID=A0AAD1WJF1_PELCU|nr:Hypothetical predicted protein [Pelobates cultripes]